MEKLGVIGGMGPEATSYFYDQLVRHTDAARDQEHLDVAILSCASMPDRTRAFETGERGPLLEKMSACTAALEGLGCAHIAIPCNTSHVFFDEIQATTSVPIIHMPRETVACIMRRAAAAGCAAPRIGVMGTDGTIASGVYARACAEAGAEAVAPDAARQRDVMSIIYDDIKAGHAPNLAAFDRVMEAFAAASCDYVILACTELSLIGRYRALDEHVVDALDVLVRVSIERSGARWRA